MLEDFINAIKSKNKQSFRSKKWKNWIAQKGRCAGFRVDPERGEF